MGGVSLSHVFLNALTPNKTSCDETVFLCYVLKKQTHTHTHSCETLLAITDDECECVEPDRLQPADSYCVLM